MIRTFQTHRIRKQTELSSSLWSFRAAEGPFSGRTYPVTVPSCWESYPDFTDYRGVGIYTKPFDFPGGNLRLEFQGVSHTAEILLDGAPVGAHYNAYTPFEVIVPQVAAGSHLLEVRADNRFSEASALHVPNDYQSYGGISRGVAAEVLPDLWIRYVHITPVRAENGWTANLEIALENLSGRPLPASVRTEINGRTFDSGTVMAGEHQILKGSLLLDDVREWSMEEPNLYVAVTTLFCDGQPVDDLIERIGFREIRIRQKRILLNGRPVRIKGFCRHEDHPQFGCALPLEAIQYDLSVIRHLGANSVRTSHYPNDQLFLDLCDETGLLVWEENHARGLSEEQMRNPNFQRQCADCIQEMIAAHYNHPSIYIWGILNECASDSEYGKSCYEKQLAQIRALDPSRPRSFASCKFKTDICFGLPEVVSYNIYPEWYVDQPAGEYLEDLYQWVQTSSEGAGKPFLITETGAGAIYGYRTPTKVKWSEEYQAEALEHQMHAVLSNDNCSGIYLWQFADTRISREWFSFRPRTMNNKGVVDEYRRRKLAYDVVKRLFEGYGNYFEE